MEKINKLLDRLYEKIPGPAFGISAGIIGMITLITASILHSMTEPFTYISHYVSNLGVGPNGSASVFNIGLLIIAIVVLPFVIYILRFLWSDAENKKLINRITFIAFILSLVTIIGMFLVAFFDMVNNPPLHVIGALMAFAPASLWVLIFTISMFLNKKISKIQLISSIILVIICTTMTIVVVLSIPLFDASKNMFSLLDINFVSLYLTSMDESLNYVRFWEWLSVWGLFLWIIETGLFTLLYKSKEKL